MTPDPIPESKVCSCPTCKCYRLVSPLGGTCGSCLTGEHYAALMPHGCDFRHTPDPNCPEHGVARALAVKPVYRRRVIGLERPW